MTLPAGLTLRDATLDDLPAIAALRSSVGWTVHDWALRAVIGKADAAFLVVADEDGELAGIGSGIAYPPSIGFVGNMVVAHEYRRRRLGTVILDAVADRLARLGCRRLELNATSEGRPLYERHGFRSRGDSIAVRLPRSANLEGDPALRTRVATASDLDALAAYDAPRFGGDRRRIMGLLLDPAVATSHLAERTDGIVGFAFHQAEEDRIGPMVADDPSVAATLLSAVFDAHRNLDSARLNLPPDNDVGAEWLSDLGVPIECWDGRMARGPDVPRRDETIYQMTVGPLG